MPCLIILALLSPGMTGCALFKKDTNKENSNANAALKAPAQFPTGGGAGASTSVAARAGATPEAAPGERDPLLFPSAKKSRIFAPIQQASAREDGAIVAGRVIDLYEQAPREAYIKGICLEDKDGKEIEAAVNSDGYFTIQGLRRGGNYKLIARAKDGDRVLAGTTYTTAPNIRVLIQVKQDFANSTAYNFPGSPAYQEKKEFSALPGLSRPRPAAGAGGAAAAAAAAAAASGEKNWTPSTETAKLGNNEADLPQALKVPSPADKVAALPLPPPPANMPAWKPGPDPQGFPKADDGLTNQALVNKGLAWPPTLEIPGSATRPTVMLQAPEPLQGDGQIGALTVPNPAAGTSTLGNPNSAPTPGYVPPNPRNSPPARVPSCVLIGRQVVNFALNGTNGQPYEFRTQRKGKVVLLDFWATYCMPCLETIPNIRKLHNHYEARGLEVIGIAYEAGGSPHTQAMRVNALHQRYQTSYRQLLGSGPACPVKSQFAIRALPTLILLDENGFILWRYEGMPSRATIAELERLIQRQLQ